MVELIIACIYFYLPAGLANAGAVVAKQVPGFGNIRSPIDGGKKLLGRRIIGDHKNWGGYLCGVVIGTLAGVIKTLVGDLNMHDYLLFNLSVWESIGLYFVMANGALMGDVVKSVIKRRLRIPPHRSWFPYDQIDHSVGAMVVASLFVPVTGGVFLIVVAAYLVIHLLTNIFSYAIGVKSVPY